MAYRSKAGTANAPPLMMLRALLTIGAVQVLTMLVLLVRTKTLAVTLGPELVGVMAVVEKLLAVIAQTASLSLPFAAVRFLPGRWSAGPAEYRDLFTRMRNLLLVLVAGATLLALLANHFAPELWGSALLPYRDVVLVAILGLPVVAIVPFLQNAVAGRMQQNRSMLLGLLHAIVLAVSVVGIVWGGLFGYYAGYAILGTILVLCISPLATQGTPRLESGAGRFPIGLPAALWQFAGALLILAFLVPYAALFVHYRLLSFHGAQTAGWMQAAVGISLSVRAVLGSAQAVYLTPSVNRGGSPEERMAWANGFESSLCVIAGLAVPPLLLFPEVVVQVLYSQAFLPGAAFVMLFTLTEVLLLLSGTYQSLVIAFDHLRFHVASNLAAQLLVVGAAVLLVQPLGILGAGLAMLAAPVALLVSTLLFLRHKHGLRVPQAVAARCAWLCTSLVAAGVIGKVMPDLDGATLAAKALAWLVTAAGFAALLTADERARVRGVLDRWSRR